ncbi:IPT/TIG domain-containing protein [Flavobacterium fryxellicola]|uniref:IPT/TIG domain-containing protein n=1 Tax=Flavobacterium fryxellicola TaxID=249352 RepID=A0A167XQN3_9FLAO|nr:T9SS sorting signal type C domain-containing protein [Flavobacterium fryxellicola]OAB28599.1 hypothetical protein FBFR_07885 [Flavobacterium fryxellicola]SHN51521.1 IPT/TIG domain-containing protein [Flavobacterium fryxellicola]
MNKKILFLNTRFLLFAFVMLLSIVSKGQTTLFQFDFENGVAPNIDNVTGIPAFSSGGIPNGQLVYSTLNPCQGSRMVSGGNWDPGDYYRFTVNTTGYGGMVFSYCNRTDNISIGTFLVRVSSNGGANWDTVLATYTPTTSNNNLFTSAFPISANDSSEVLIEISKVSGGVDNGRTFIIDNATLVGYLLPTITSFTPSNACAASGASVVITGTNFSGATVVNFNGVPSTSFTVNSNTQITAQLPATVISGAITVTTPGGIATSTNIFALNSTPTVTATASSTSISSGANISLTASASPSTQNTVLLSEGFNGATNSWNKINNSTGGTVADAAWKLRPDGYVYNYGGGYPARTFRSNDNSQFYLSNSADQNGGTTATILQSPVMNSVGYTSLSLEFYQYNLDFDSTDFSRVEVSTNGTLWTTLSTTTTTQGSENNFLKAIINLDSYINQATLYVRFKYDAQFDWFWAIDNVTVSGNRTIPYTYSWAAIPTGTSGLPVGAATASMSNGSIVVNPTTGTFYTVTATNPDGGCTGTSIVNVTVLPLCVPPGNTITTASAVCANTPFTLSLQNTSASSAAYQWQTSVDNISWINVPSVPFFNTDFASQPANTNVYGDASVTGGELILTAAGTSRLGGYVVQSTPGANINSFTASFDYRMFDGNGADGMSLSYGSSMGNNQGGGEEGEGTGLTIKFDSYDNTTNATASQIRIFYGGVQIFSNTLNSFALRNSAYRNVLLSTDGNGLLSLKIGTTTIVSGLSLPAGYLSSNKSNWKFKFSARTGGLNDKHSIDNLNISYLNSTFTTTQIVPTYYRSIVTCGGTTNTSTPILVTMDPMPPILGAVTPLTCVVPRGSVVLSGLPSSGTLNQTGFITKSYPITATTMTISDLVAGDYYFAVNNGTCESVISKVVTIVDKSSTTWNGSGWSNGEPSITSRIIFAGNFNSTKDVIGCDCTVNSGANVVFKYINPTLGHTLTVTNDVKVIGSGKLTFENNASLVQTADVITNTNTGKISYQRQTSPYKPFDYIYWSSPVAGQKLRDVSAQTPLDKFYSFDVAAYDWKQEDPNMIMKNGVGYIIRGPQYVLPIPPGLHQASFFGVPNNGLITVPIPSTAVNSESSALLGNPYPSALDANKLLRDNSSILEGTLYFWTHNTAIQDVGNITNGSQGSGALAYTSDDYATYNLTGGVTVVATGNILGGITQIVNKPLGKIASGQSFFAGIKAVAGTVKFENSMRVGVGGITGTNSQFFRTANKKFDATTTSENHRVWLNLTNTQGAFKQLLVGYITAATNAYDPSFDGVSFNGNEFIDFYSITGDETLTIQGRALPFDENDVVPLGYSSAIEGGFTISIDEVDGLFTSQNIFLEDKLNGSVHDLKKSGYTFETTIGTFDNRFVLRYTDKTLGVADLDQLEDQVIISKDKNELKIKSANETIKRVTIFDLLGKKVFDKEALDETEFRSSNVSLFKQTGIVKVTLATGQVISKKVAF